MSVARFAGLQFYSMYSWGFGYAFTPGFMLPPAVAG
jgi:hypothetical protein